MIIRKIALFYFIFLFNCWCVFGQLPGMKVYTQLDGYPANIGYLLQQDANGFIWIGTDNGAVRFDGQQFLVYDERDGLKDKEILTVLPDCHGHVIFLPMLNNITCYRHGIPYDSIDFTRIKNKLLNNGYIDSKTGEVWLSDAENDAYVYHLKEDSLFKIKVPLNLPFSLHHVIDHQLYLSYLKEGEQDQSIAVYNSNQNKLYNLKDEQGKEINTHLFKFSEKGDYLASLLGRELRIYQLDQYKSINLLVTLKVDHEIKRIYLDPNNHLWLALRNHGLEYWGDVNQLTEEHKPWSLLENTVINDLLIDRNNNLWITTAYEGLLFTSVRHWRNAQLVSKLNLLHFRPQSIYQDSKGRLLIGHLLSPLLAVVEDNNTQILPLDGGASEGIRRIVQLQDHVGLINSTNFHLLSPQLEQQLLSVDYTFKDAIPYGDSSILFATHYNVIWAIKQQGKYTYRSLFEGRTTCIRGLIDTSLLIGSPNGLYFLSGVDKKARLVDHPVLRHAHITDIASVGEVKLVGTGQQGLFAYDSVNKTFRNIVHPKASGIGFIRQIYIQNDTTYWLASDRGAFVFTFNSHQQLVSSRIFTFLDGLPSSNVTGIVVKNDTAYFTTPSGLGILILNEPLVGTLKYPLTWIVKAKTDNQLVYFPATIELFHDDNNLTISLSAISFESIGDVHFRYQLEGLNRKWVVSEGREINFNGLAPGEYLLKVYAINQHNLASEEPGLLTIVVHPAIWQTWWFMVLVAIVFTLLVFMFIYLLVIRNRNKRIRQAHQKIKLAELELEAIKAQINPHFIFNCLNSIQFFIYKNRSEEAKEYLNLFSLLIRQTMQYSTETIISLQEEVDYLFNYLELEKMRFKDQLSYEINVDRSLSKRRQIPAMLIQPYVENALKHGLKKNKKIEHGKIELRFEENSDGWLNVTIKDNGPGISTLQNTNEKNMLGLRLSGGRIEAYNELYKMRMRVSVKSVTSISNLGSNGTIVELLIPPLTHESVRVYSTHR